MPARTKIQDAAEVERWFADGRPYGWMVAEYQRKYNLEVSASMFSNYRRRRGLERRVARDDDLIPWEIALGHRSNYLLAMLRVEARRRQGFELRATDAGRLEAWKRSLAKRDVVVHYDRRTEQGWWLVPRRPGIDTDLIRRPDRKTTRRRNADD